MGAGLDDGASFSCNSVCGDLVKDKSDVSTA